MNIIITSNAGFLKPPLNKSECCPLGDRNSNNNNNNNKFNIDHTSTTFSRRLIRDVSKLSLIRAHIDYHITHSKTTSINMRQILADKIKIL